MVETMPQTSRDPAGVSPTWRVLAIVLMVVLIVGGAGLLVSQDSGDSDRGDFPTGAFDVTATGEVADFFEDGTGVFSGGYGEMPFTYAVNGKLYTEMTFEWPGGTQAPATYYWSFDGERLSFELWGDDVRPSRAASYSQDFVRMD